MPDLLAAFRQHLIDEGIVRAATEPAVAGEPPMLVELPGGPRAPGEGDELERDPNMALTIYAGGDLTAGEFDGFIRRTTIDVHYRTVDARLLEPLDRAIVNAMHDEGGQRRRGWVMGGLYVLETGQWAGLQPLERSKAGGHHFVTKVYVETYR